MLTIDVEDWSDATIVWGKGAAPFDGRRIPIQVEALLEQLKEHAIVATFFILGQVAQVYPDVVRQIVRAGHEVACHGFSHQPLPVLGRDRFDAELGDAQKRLQDLSGEPIQGFRAATWSLTRKSAWAVDVLAERGFRYDSSVLPMASPFFGEPKAPVEPYWLKGPAGGRVLELPPTVFKRGRWRLAVAGGVWWRMLPAPILWALLDRCPPPTVLYLHPWEWDWTDPPFPPKFPRLSRLALRMGVGNLRRNFRRAAARSGYGPMAAAAAVQASRPELPWARLSERGWEAGS